MKVAFIVSGFPDKLNYLENNREKVAEKLKEYGWHVKAFIFENQATLNSCIEELKEKQIEDFILFYTGHGDTSNQDSVLTLKLNDETSIDINSLYRDYLSKINPKKLSIVLDACYSGNFEGQKIRDNMEYLCSSDFDEPSFECSTLEQSYFSYYFCEAIDQQDGEITLDRIRDYINNKVENQTPKHYSFNSKMIIANKPLYKKYEDILNSQETKNIKKLLEHADIENLQKIAYSYLPTNRIGTLPNNISSIIDALLNIGKLENGSIPAICFFNDLNTSQYNVMLDEYLQYLKRHWNISTIYCESNPIVDECSLIIDIDFKDGQNDKYEISVWKYANGKIESKEDIGGVFDIKTFLDKVFDLSVKLNIIYKNIYLEIVLPDKLLTDKLCEWSDSRGIRLIQKSKYLQRIQSRFRQPSQVLINKCNQLSDITNCVDVSKQDSVSTYNHDITDADLLYFCDKTIDNFDELKKHIDYLGIPIVILPTNDNCKFESTLLASNPHELKEKLCAYRMNNIPNDNSKFLFIYDDTDKIPEHYKKPQINLYGW